MIGVQQATLELCYTVTMDPDQHIWRIWANRLHQWGLANWTASFLEAAGPITLIAAQALYVVQPLAYRALPEQHWQALTEMLEDTVKVRSFAALLREENLT
jgi:hypothetical protein